MFARRLQTSWGMLAGAAGLLALSAVLLNEAPAAPEPLEASLQKASAEGKYQMLVAQIKVANDVGEYGAFHDLGYRAQTEYAGHTGLPTGHWVYVAPYWYIWRDLAGAARPVRPWGPEQAIGEPNVWPQFGDRGEAWASLSEDAQDEWLLLEYPELVQPQAVIVYATFNPGALERVTAFKPDGTEVEVWRGQDPTPVGSEKGISVIPIRPGFRTNRIRLHLASKTVGGWNEIDAVGLRTAGRTLWARGVEASTTYAQMQVVAAPNPEDDPVLDQRLMALEGEVRKLRQAVRMLEEKARKKKNK